MLITLLACANTPGTFEDGYGVPRKDLADCTSTASQNGAPISRTHYDERGYPFGSDNVDTDAEWVEGLSFSFELDDQDRPMHAESSYEDDTWTSDWTYEGKSWRVLTHTSAREGSGSTTWTWTWDGDSVVVSDGGDCEDHGTLAEGVRMAGWESWCGEELSSASTFTWEDRLQGSVHTSYDDGEVAYVTQVTLTYDEDGRLSREVQADPDGTDSALEIDLAWDCE